MSDETVERIDLTVPHAELILSELEVNGFVDLMSHVHAKTPMALRLRRRDQSPWLEIDCFAAGVTDRTPDELKEQLVVERYAIWSSTGSTRSTSTAPRPRTRINFKDLGEGMRTSGTPRS